MPRIVIIGGGFAGVWSAAAAARLRGEDELSITLIAPNDDMVLRPRLHQLTPDRARVPLRRILKPIGVEHLKAKVTEIDTSADRLVADGAVVGYDRLVLATGSRLVRPEIPGADLLHDIDTAGGSARLAASVDGRTDSTAVVIGAGFTGLEIATELAARGRVMLVERATVIAPDLGPGPRPVIEAALAELGIEVRLGTSAASVEETGVVLTDGTRIGADVVVWTAGMKASSLTEQIPGERDRLGRLRVDRHLRVFGNVFAAGDVAAAHADADHLALQSCQYATPLGKAAGHNAAADLLGLPLVDFTPDPYVTCLDLGAAGAVFTTGWERTVRMSGTDGKKMKRTILDVIHPPVDDAERILQKAADQSVGVRG
jgi:NADH dehydrogenase